jgi:hypothetical protein
MSALIDLMRAELLAGRTITASEYPDPAAFHGAVVVLLDELPVIESWRTCWESRSSGFRLRQRQYRLPAAMTKLGGVVGQALGGAYLADSNKADNQGMKV